MSIKSYSLRAFSNDMKKVARPIFIKRFNIDFIEYSMTKLFNIQ